MKNSICRLFLLVCIIAALFILQGCGKNNFSIKKAVPLLIEEASLDDIPGGQPNDPDNPSGNPGKDSGTGLKPADGLHPIFSAPLGSTIPSFSMGVVDTDPSGLSLMFDWDGDGVPNDLEVMSSALVADYPRIVARISTPILMELRKSETNTSENYTETIENADTKETITNSMENKHYAQMNTKTTPYVVKESQSTDAADAYSFGEAHSSETRFTVNIGFPIIGTSDVAAGNSSTSTTVKRSDSQNYSVSNKFAQSTMSEKTVFEDVDYVDNLDRNGIEIKDDKVQSMSTNYRNSEKTKETYEVGPNAGYVRAGLYIKNDTVNMPVRVSNVICTLAFRTAGGAILPVKTFRLRNDDYSEFDQEVYGGEELGPYTIEVTGLNTYEVKQALRNGYTPQITVVSHDMHRVEDSNYNPGVDNLKIIEETAKSRTALIKIIGTNTRDIYRTTAFDISANGEISPGISLKKALFNILSDSIGKGETWAFDDNEKELTVPDTGLKWKEDFVADPDKPNEYKYSSNKKGNTWRLFETYIKTYTDEYNQTHRIETIKRIGALNAYNPFSTVDNPNYNPNEFLEREELLKMKYWIILHNGRYFEGDINDPIWAGERYEIVCMDVRDFSEYFKTYSFTPVQSMEYFKLDTSWNKLNNIGEFARSKYLGRIVKSDVVHLEINLAESRFLFDEIYNNNPAGNSNDKQVGKVNPANNNTANEWYDFNYTLQSDNSASQGIPMQFSHYVEGGFNNIKVTINESKNALEYEITFKEKGNTEALWKKVKVAADDVKLNNGEVFITSLSKDVDGNPIGLIQGKLLSAGGLEYIINVKANGLANNVPVYTWSITNNMDESIGVVYNADVTSIPGGNNGFTFSAAGLADNWMYIRISDADYTEYYKIILTGPYNYPHNGNNPPLNDDTAPVRECIGHRGLNKIHIPNPPGDVREDGIYKVMVYAYNTNCVSGGISPRPAENDSSFLSLAHDRYAAQRIYQPRLNASLFKMKAIDLEVNFNDGNGWYRLKLDPGEWYDGNQKEDKRIIDCRFNSYVNYDTQKFHIFFKPPCGVYDEYSKFFAGNHDVFAGGRETVDLYLRTAAEPRYRNTFWLKDQGSDIFAETLNYIATPYYITPDFPAEQYTEDVPPVRYANFVNYWINSEITDAANIEGSLSSNMIGGGDQFNPGMKIGFKGTDLQNYFFSPLEYRKYDVRASLVEKLPQQQNYVVDPPKFYAQPGCIQQQDGWGIASYLPGIVVNNIESQYASYYEVYYKLVNPSAYDPSEPLIGPDENPLNWNSVRIEEDGALNAFGLRDVAIPVANYNQRYLVAVIGYNMYGRSEPSYFDGYDGIAAKTDDADNRGQVSAVFVSSCNLPAKPVFTVALNPLNNKHIDVLNIHSDGGQRYIIEWKESLEAWTSASRYDSFADKQLAPQNLNYTITKHHGMALRPWKKYSVRALAVTLDNRSIEPSLDDEVNIVTGTVRDFGSPELAMVNHTRNVFEHYAGLSIENIVLPEGTVRYTITGIRIRRWERWRADGTIKLHDEFTLPDVANSNRLLPDNTLVRKGDSFNSWEIHEMKAAFSIHAYNQDGDSLYQEFDLDVVIPPEWYN